MTALKNLSPAGWLKDIDDNFNVIGERGTYTCVANDATANEVNIDTGKEDATAFIVQIWRANKMVLGDAVVTLVDGVLNIADGASTYAVTSGDVITWIVF